MMYRVVLWGTLGVLLMTGLQPTVSQDIAADAADDWLMRVQDRYAALSGLQATYEQEVSTELNEGTEQRQGTLYATPDAFRVEADRQTIVSNSETIWVHDEIRNQVIVSTPDEQRPDLATPNTLFARFSDMFTVVDSEETSAGMVRLSLEANDSAADYEAMVLWVRPDDATITELELTDGGGTHVRIQLSDMTFDPSFDEGVFTFEPPEGVEVVDLRDG